MLEWDDIGPVDMEIYGAAWLRSGDRNWRKRSAKTPPSPAGLAKSANHFTCATEHPYWAKGRRPVAIIGRHAFYRLDRY